MLSAVENFLIDFHNAHPGLTTKALGTLPVLFRGGQFGSSYEVLSATIPATNTPIQLLDLACGDGFLLSLLAARSQPGLTLNGIDMSSSELNAARTRLAPTVTLLGSRAQSLPFATGSFDHILSHLALMLMDDIEQVLREVHRVLKSGASFAFIIGAPPPPSIAFATYVDILSRYPPQNNLSQVQFGDQRFRHPDGIHELLAPTFRNVSIEDIHFSKRLTPSELWYWFLDMYDLNLRSETSRRSAEREYLATVVPACNSDGKLEYLGAFRYVSAVAI